MIAFNCFEIARWMLRRLETEAEVVNVNELFGMIDRIKWFISDIITKTYVNAFRRCIELSAKDFLLQIVR